MEFVRFRLGPVLALWAVLASWALPAQAGGPETQPCRTLAAAGHSYGVCVFDLRDYVLKLFLRDQTGAAYGNLSNLVAALKRDGPAPIFAMNAGMYEPDRSPVGLYVEHGVQLKSANVANGAGNFHLKPNGVFYVIGNMAGVVETSAYLQRHMRPDFATQSGPMLVIGGDINPKFLPDATSRKVRNGVGVRDGHIAVFAISFDAVTFAEFAELFRGPLACPDALFLDGSISSLYAPSLAASNPLLPAGPMVAAFPRAGQVR